MTSISGRLLVRAYHDGGEPAEVTAALGIDPTDSQTVGQPSPFPEMGPIPASGWFLEIPVSGDLDEASRQLQGLMDRLSPRAGALRTLSQAGWEFDLVVAPAPEAPYVVFPRDVIHQLAALELPLVIELWAHDRYDSEG